MEDIIIPYKDVPLEIKLEINQFTSNSTVALLGYDNKHNPIPGLLASGTFVEINSKFGVLTAKHVWERFKKVEYISFSFLGKTHLTLERTEYIRCYSPKNEIDICFLEITPTILGTIKAASNFHPIVSNSYSDEKTEIEKRFCITVGFPLEIQSTQERRLDILRYYTHIVKHSIISDDWDIIELDIKAIDPPNELPKTFGGMSGGGIWSFKAFYNFVNNERRFFIRKNLKDALLAGVNYCEEFLNGNVHKIYGVGPISIYSGMTKLVTKW